MFDQSSHKYQYYTNFDGSPALEPDDDEGVIDPSNNIRFIERLIDNDENDPNNDATSYQSMHSPPQFNMGLRVPVSSF